MAMSCQYHSGGTGSAGAHGGGSSPSPNIVTKTTTVTSSMTCDNCGATMGNSKMSAETTGSANNNNNSGKNVLSTRITTFDWETANRANFKLADKEKGLAEQLRNDAWRAVKATDRQTRTRQAANTKRLTERVTDITMWKEELVAEIRADEVEMDNMKEFIRALELALHETSSPLSVAEECLTQRENRTGVDRVRDDVELALIKEVETIKRCQDKMRKMLDKAAAQQKATRAAQHACDMDARNKQHSQNIDERMHQLHNGSTGIGHFPGIEAFDNTLSVPASWQHFTQENLERARQQREFSVKLRGEMDTLMKACATDMWNQFNCVNNAFNARVQQTRDANSKLSAHLQKTTGEIKEMERTVACLRKALHDKEAPLKVAQTRLEERTRRVDVELCKDPAMLGLQKEIDDLRESIRVLEVKLREAEEALVRLRKARAALEHDMQTKDRSLDIDAKVCLGMRKRMAAEPKSCPMVTDQLLI